MAEAMWEVKLCYSATKTTDRESKADSSKKNSDTTWGFVWPQADREGKGGAAGNFYKKQEILSNKVSKPHGYDMTA